MYSFVPNCKGGGGGEFGEKNPQDNIYPHFWTEI